MTRRQAPWIRSSGLAAGLAAVSLILAGCVSLPSAGNLPHVNPLPNSDRQSQLVITPRAPGPQWQPTEIVRGFLVASGANPDDLSIARDYLTKAFSKAWHPGSTPDVIDAGPAVATSTVPGHLTSGQSSAQVVTVTSQHLETLVAAGPNEAGRLQVIPGPAPYKFTFDLVQVEGKWRIDSITEPTGKTSDSILLLTDSDFERDYLPRNLYYLASGSPQTLVPYPVYIPAQAGQLSGAQQLVDAVGAPPPTRSNWLYNAISTAFKPRTELTVQVQSGSAVVALSGKGARADQATLDQMEAQLVWTLTYAPDSPSTGINSVELRIGRSLTPNLLQRQFMSWIPQGPSGPLYYQTLDRNGHPKLEAFRPTSNFGSPDVGQAGASGKTHSLAEGTPSPVPLPTGIGRGPFTTIAVSPTLPGGAITFAGCRGKSAYVAEPLLFNNDLLSTDLPGNCTSLSWDTQGDVWAVAGNDVYVLEQEPSGLRVIPVSIAAQQIAPSDDFVSLKVAPDGLRVAMIVRGKNATRVYISAITKRRHSSYIYLAQGGPVLTAGPDLVKPIALAWWGSDHLLVLERRHDVSQLYDVPLNGGESTKVLTAPVTATSVTANGSFVAVGTPDSAAHGQPTLQVSRGLDGPWFPVTVGRTPAYVG